MISTHGETVPLYWSIIIMSQLLAQRLGTLLLILWQWNTYVTEFGSKFGKYTKNKWFLITKNFPSHQKRAWSAKRPLQIIYYSCCLYEHDTTSIKVTHIVVYDFMCKSWAAYNLHLLVQCIKFVLALKQVCKLVLNFNSFSDLYKQLCKSTRTQYIYFNASAILW